MTPLRPALPSASWTRSDAFHLTFAFLGEQGEEVLAPIRGRLEAAVASIPRFEVTVSGCGFFPSASRARVAWIALQPEEPLKLVAEAVRSALRASKVDFDVKPYVPHLTLARLRRRWTLADIELFREAFGCVSTGPAEIDSVILYQSRLSPNGAIHTPLQRVALA